MVQTIKFDVDLYRMIKPSSVQDAGMQGDHRVTELEFNISSALWSWLNTKKGSGKLVYRFDGVDGSREIHRSDIETLSGTKVTYPLENYLTRYGGLVEVQLVISVLGTNNSEVEFVKNEFCSFTAKLKLAFSNFVHADNDTEFQSLSSLAAIAKSSAQIAQDKAAEARDAQTQTEKAKQILQSGDTVFIFDGGSAADEFDVKFVVDDKMDGSSGNLVPNKVIKDYIDNLTHPVGSVWIGGKDGDTPIDPSEIFGGKWELKDKEFANIIIDDKEGTGGTFTKEEIVSGYRLVALCSGHTIRLRLYFTTNMVFKDGYGLDSKGEPITSKAVGQLNLEKLGIESFCHSLTDIVAMSDTSNGLLMAIINNDGLVSISDVIKINTVNEEVIISTEITCRGDDMLNSFCDKFYWQRTE